MSDHVNEEGAPENRNDAPLPVAAEQVPAPLDNRDVVPDDLMDIGDAHEVMVTRFSEIENSGLAEGADDDEDERLFRDAFGDFNDDDMDDEENFALERPVLEPIFNMPTEALEAMAAASGNQLLLGAERAGLPAVDVRRAMGMRKMSEMPGYLGAGRLGQSIRQLGRKIFNPLPCFDRMAEASRAAGRDPLGEVWIFSNFDPEVANPVQDANKQEMLDALINWVRGNGGNMVDAATIGFTSMPGYSTNIVLFATENESYLIVQESERAGAPFAANYIYSWLGGMQVYRQDNNIGNPLDRLSAPDENGRVHITVRRAVINGELQQERQALQAPAREIAREPDRLPAPVEIVNPLPPEAPRQQQNNPRAPQRDGPNARHPAPQPAAKVQTPLQGLRGVGFTIVGTSNGPALTMTLANGNVAMVTGHGKSISLAREFVVDIRNSNGEDVNNAVGVDMNGVLELCGLAGPEPDGGYAIG